MRKLTDAAHNQAVLAAQQAELDRIRTLREAAAASRDPAQWPPNMIYNPLVPFAPPDDDPGDYQRPAYYPFEPRPLTGGPMHQSFSRTIRHMVRKTSNAREAGGKNDVPSLDRARIALCGRTVRQGASFRLDSDLLFFNFADTDTAEDVLPSDEEDAGAEPIDTADDGLPSDEEDAGAEPTDTVDD
ncbi:hypothetical protein EXIGLDRAFT_781942, partial [Exidia glandulosa HHB12029]